MLDRTRSRFLFAALLLTSACSDDAKKDITLDDGSAATADQDGGATSLGGDLGTDDLGAAGSGTDDLGTNGLGTDTTAPLGIDGMVLLPDGQVSSPDDSLADGGVVADGAAEVDGSALDASSGACDVNDPRYGCGTLSGKDWVSFADFEIDLANKVAWTKPMTVVDDDELAAICPALNAGGFAWELPQMEDVRKLAAGCEKTMPGGSCQVDVDEVITAEAGDCSCGDIAGSGPNKGQFCRPEVPQCETFWVWTHSYETGFYQHWFYDVNTGAIVPEYVAVGIANRAKGRCVHDLGEGELPAIAAP